MANNARISKFVFLSFIAFVFFLLIIQITIFTVNRNDSFVGYIRYTTNNRQVELLNFSSQIEYVDSQEIKCKYNEVDYKICIEDNVKTIYATKSSSYLRNETIKYVSETNRLKEVSVDDEKVTSIIKFIWSLLVQIIIIAFIALVLHIIMKILTMHRLVD